MRFATIVALTLVAAAAAACMNPGEAIEFGPCKLYYKKPVTSEQAQRVGKVLTEAGYFVEKVERDVQLLKDGETFVLRFVSKPEQITPEVEGEIKLMIVGLTQALGGAEPRIEFCDAGLETFKTL